MARPGRPRIGRTCEICGSTYNASHAAQRTCSRACGVLASGRRPKVRRPAFIRIWTPTCTECGKVFVTRHQTQVVCGKTCRYRRSNRLHHPTADHHLCICGKIIGNTRSRCDDCLAKSRKARRLKEHMRRRKGGRPDYSPADVFERDGWRCHICRRRCKPWKIGGATSQPRSATIDHLIPLALGGTNSKVNVATACFECNTKKRHGAVGEQLALIG